MIENMGTDAMRADGVLFDKDGTLFDFEATWNSWTLTVINEFSKGDEGVAATIAEAIHFDRVQQRYRPTSPIIAGTNREAAEAVASALPGSDVDAIEMHMMTSSAHAPLSEAVPLAPFLDGLAGRGIRLGVMTNDTEHAARAHLTSAGVLERFDFVIGFDSGFGAKPDPDPLLAFAEAQGLAPARVVMVGDSTHDLVAGRAAGMQTAAVLTGMAGPDELAPFADVVLPDIGHLTEWLAQAG